MNNLPNWTHFSRPQHVGTRSFVFGLLMGFALGLLPWENLFVWTAGRFGLLQARREEQKALSPQTAYAYKLDLSYEQVLAKPQDFVGKPVVWCVDHPDAGSSAYLEGKPSQPLSFSNWDLLPPTGSRGGHCVKVLAVVESAGRKGFGLRFVGLP